MYRNRLALVALLSLVTACDGMVGAPEPSILGDEEFASPPGEDPTEPAPETPGTPVGQVVPSAKQRLQFKGGERWLTDASTILSVDADTVCRELGESPCLEVHGISLGGVEPYGLTIYESVSNQPLSAPLALERMAWMLCGERVERDDTLPGGLFSEVLSVDATDASFDDAARSLVSRALLREASDAELGAFSDLATELDPKDWALASCFSTLTHVEFLFY